MRPGARRPATCFSRAGPCSRSASTPRPGQRLTYRCRRAYPDAAYLPVLYVPSPDRVVRYDVVVRRLAGVMTTFDVVAPHRGGLVQRLEV